MAEISNPYNLNGIDKNYKSYSELSKKFNGTTMQITFNESGPDASHRNYRYSSGAIESAQGKCVPSNKLNFGELYVMGSSSGLNYSFCTILNFPLSKKLYAAINGIEYETGNDGYWHIIYYPVRAGTYTVTLSDIPL